MAREQEYILAQKRITNELEHDSDIPETKRVSLYGYDGSSKVRVRVDDAGKLIMSGLVPEAYDYIALTYDASAQVTGVEYKASGATGTTVAFLTLAYSAGNVVSVTRT